MQRALIGKTLILLIVALGLLIPLAMIESTVRERAYRRDEAIRSVQQSFAGPQALVTPLVVWPYREEWEAYRWIADEKRNTLTKHSESRQIIVFADRTTVNGKVDVRNDRYRGLHRVRTYEAGLRLATQIPMPQRKLVKVEHSGGRLIWGEPVLVLGVSDVRGLRGAPALTIDGKTHAFEQGTRGVLAAGGINAPFVPPADGAPIAADISLTLAGMEQLAVVPTAGTTTVELHSSWPHPKFSGDFLPVKHAVLENGFDATWSVAALASGVQAQIQALSHADPARAALNAFKVELIEPVNVYLLSERAAKYGVLFVSLMLAAVFLFEAVKRLAVHPIQYAFVGLALAIFFLLLLSLSEHLAFPLAYALAAAACVALISFYLRHALQGWRNGLGFGGALATLYGALYVILTAEQTALLMGALLLFIVLAAMMIATRKVDWYRLPAEKLKPSL